MIWTFNNENNCIFENYTFVDIPEEYADEVLEIMRKGTIKGNKVVIERAQGKKPKRRVRTK